MSSNEPNPRRLSEAELAHFLGLPNTGLEPTADDSAAAEQDVEGPKSPQTKPVSDPNQPPDPNGPPYPWGEGLPPDSGWSPGIRRPNGPGGPPGTFRETPQNGAPRDGGLGAIDQMKGGGTGVRTSTANTPHRAQQRPVHGLPSRPPVNRSTGSSFRPPATPGTGNGAPGAADASEPPQDPRNRNPQQPQAPKDPVEPNATNAQGKGATPTNQPRQPQLSQRPARNVPPDDFLPMESRDDSLTIYTVPPATPNGTGAPGGPPQDSRRGLRPEDGRPPNQRLLPQAEARSRSPQPQNPQRPPQQRPAQRQQPGQRQDEIRQPRPPAQRRPQPEPRYNDPWDVPAPPRRRQTAPGAPGAPAPRGRQRPIERTVPQNFQGQPQRLRPQRWDPATYEGPRQLSVGEQLRDYKEIGIYVVVAIVIAFLVKAVFLQAFFIPSESMFPLLTTSDRILVNKLVYKLGPVERGDVVVFKAPPGEPDKSIDNLIKRVIALPGDTVEAKDGVLFLNGKPQDEPYVAPGAITDWVDEDGNDLPKIVIPPGMFWAMGDNRENSGDSRVFGPVDQKLIVGRTELKIWPLNRIGRT